MPTVPVPRFWIQNSAVRIAAVVGITAGPKCGAMIFMPSTALNTEIAGVIMLSPKNSAAAKIPSTPTIHTRRLEFLSASEISASRARLPPSPRLSARMIKVTYLSVTSIMIAQKINDSTPSTRSSSRPSAWLPLKVSFKAYRGLVPMSP